MKTWKVLLVLALSFGVIGGWWMIGCGGDDDEDQCKKLCDRCDNFDLGGACVGTCKECGIGDCNVNAECWDVYTCIALNCD